MRNVLRFVLAVVAGFVVGSVVNMLLIMVSGHVIAPPAGADVTTTEGLRAALPLFEPKHFLFPFLAHALGTLAGAWVATKIAPHSSWIPAMIIGLLFLAGGVAASFMLPAPRWFVLLDLIGAYVAFAWLGFILGRTRTGVAPRAA